jgi:hypothetical protein
LKIETGANVVKTGTKSDPALPVEIRVREQNSDLAAASEHEVAGWAAAQGWVLRLTVLVAVLAVAGIYVGVHIGSGWVPADDGTLSQSALRVMQGQLPHRDFGEIYTGGLSFIHALAFRALGVNLMALRVCVFLFFLAWIPAVYYVALRFVRPVAAGAVTLLAVAWSYPNYPAAMPSWYNLFFATFGAAALLRFLEARTRRWLFVAGVCGGISILIKIIGAYYIAGVLLFLAFHEQNESRNENGAKGSGWPYRIFSAGSLFLFLATVVLVMRARLGLPEFYQFVLPSATVVALIILGERGICAATSARFGRIFRVVAPFVAGVSAPVFIFLIPYTRSGAVSQFFSGVIGSALERSAGLGVVRPLGVEKLLFVLPLVGVLAAAMYWDKFQGKVVGTALGLGAAVIVAKAAQSFDTVYGIWCSVAVLTPIVVLLGAALVLAKRGTGRQTELERQQVVLLASLAATCSLVQFPFAAAIYLSYMVPLTLMAIVAIVSTGKTQPGTYALTSVLGLYLAFGVVSLVPRYIYEITWIVGPMQTMQSPRSGGLRIEEAAFFDSLAAFLHQHSPNRLMFAGNDCPELYFLAGLTNVAHDDGGETPEAILKAIRSDDLNLVVVNDAPFFPGAAMRPDVKAEIASRFPHSTRFGIFDVFWKK